MKNFFNKRKFGISFSVISLICFYGMTAGAAEETEDALKSSLMSLKKSAQKIVDRNKELSEAIQILKNKIQTRTSEAASVLEEGREESKGEDSLREGIASLTKELQDLQNQSRADHKPVEDSSSPEKNKLMASINQSEKKIKKLEKQLKKVSRKDSLVNQETQDNLNQRLRDIMVEYEKAAKENEQIRKELTGGDEEQKMRQNQLQGEMYRLNEKKQRLEEILANADLPEKNLAVLKEENAALKEELSDLGGMDLNTP